MASASDLLKCLNLKFRSSLSGNNASRRLLGVAFTATRTLIRLLQMEEALSDSFYTGKDRSLPRSTQSRTTSCLNLSGFPPCAVCPATYWAHSVLPDSDLYLYSPDAGGRHCFTGCSYSKPNGECQACCAQYAHREPALVFLAQYKSPNNQCQAEQSREYHNPETHVLGLSLQFDDSIMLVSQ